MEGPTVARGGQLWQPYMVRGTIGGSVFGPAGPLAARTTCGMTGPNHSVKRYGNLASSDKSRCCTGGRQCDLSSQRMLHIGQQGATSSYLLLVQMLLDAWYFWSLSSDDIGEA